MTVSVRDKILHDDVRCLFSRPQLTTAPSLIDECFTVITNKEKKSHTVF